MINKIVQKIIYDSTEKKEKVMFSRKLDELNKIIARLQDHEEKISQLMIEKQPILDELQTLRNNMVKICVHPKDFLEEQENHIYCKFCNKRLKVNVRQA